MIISSAYGQIISLKKRPNRSLKCAEVITYWTTANTMQTSDGQAFETWSQISVKL